ncbi:MAG: GDSL-type esterase/lipase family protein [Myxococcota bacterium]|nr:GDSL-type esterase/lipase family protein [Myxococcota bacterium]
MAIISGSLDRKGAPNMRKVGRLVWAGSLVTLGVVHCSTANLSSPMDATHSDASVSSDVTPRSDAPSNDGSEQGDGGAADGPDDVGDGSCRFDPGVDGAVRIYAADDPNIQYFGRFDTANPAKPRFPASATYVTAKFRGNSVSVKVSDEYRGGNSNFLDAFVDNLAPTKVTPAQLQVTFDVTPRNDAGGSLLPCGDHRITLVKRTEADMGYSEFRGFEFAEILPADPPPAHKIEIIGDSITCGAGVEASSVAAPECSQNGLGGPGYGQGIENGDEAYGVILARALNAQWHVTCASGVGITRNYYNRYDSRTMPQLYPYLYPEDMANPTLWDPMHVIWVPDAIVIALGTNDFSRDGAPDGGVRPAMDILTLQQGYIAFIDMLKRYYPGVHFFLASSPILGNGYPGPADMQLNDHQTTIRNVVAYYAADAGVPVDAIMLPKVIGSGCGGHPGMQQQADAGNQMARVIKTAMGW